MQHENRTGMRGHTRCTKVTAIVASCALVAALIPVASFSAAGGASAAYSATDSATIQAHVELVDAEDDTNVLDIAAHQFRFELLDESGEALRTTTNDALTEAGQAGDGDVSFNAIRYTDAGTYTYYITQDDKSADGYTYDTSAYEVTVVAVEDEDGDIVVESVEYADEAIDDIESYLEELAALESDDEDATADAASDADEDAEATVDADADEASTDAADEAADTDDVDADATADTDDADTDADTDTDEDADDDATDDDEVTGPTFVNTYSASNTLTLTAWKQLEKGELAGGEFDFTLQAVTLDDAGEVAADDDGAYIDASDTTPMPDEATTQNGASESDASADAGVITFDIDYALADVGSTYYYVLSEDVPSDATADEDGTTYGSSDDDVYIYDSNTYLYSVEVCDDGDGTLSFNQSVTNLVTNEALASDEPVFTNVLKDGTLSIAKSVSDDSQDDGTDDDFTFDVTLAGSGVNSDGGYDYTVYDDDGSVARRVVYDDDGGYTVYDGDGNVTGTYASDGTSSTATDDEAADEETSEEAADDEEADEETTLVQSVVSALSSVAESIANGVQSLVASVFGTADDDEEESSATVAADDDDTEETVTFPVTGTTSDNDRSGSKYINGCTWTIEEIVETTTNTDETTGEETTTETVTGYSLSIYPTAAADDLATYLAGTTDEDDTTGDDTTDDDDTTGDDTTGGDGTGDEGTGGDTPGDSTDEDTTGSDGSGGSGTPGNGTLADETDEDTTDEDTTDEDETADLTIAGFFAQAEESGTTYAGYLGADADTDYGPWCAYAGYITEAHVYGDITCGSYLQSMFEGCLYMESVDGLENMDTSGTSKMEYMFYECDSLETISDMTGWDISSVTSTRYMFAHCFALEEASMPTGEDQADESWSLKNLSYMFYMCSALTTVGGLQGWDTSGVTDMRGMYYGCENLYYIGNDDDDGDYGDGMASWDVSSVKTFAYMFHGCTSLESLDLSEWDTSSATSFEHMFSSYVTTDKDGTYEYDSDGNPLLIKSFGASGMSLRVLRIGASWDTGSVVNFSYMFAGCAKLMCIVEETSSSDVSDYNYTGTSIWDVSSATSMDYLFYNCSSLAELDVSTWQLNTDEDDFTSLKTYSGGLALHYMFYGCSSLGKTADELGADTDGMLTYTTSGGLTFSIPARMLEVALDVSGWDTSCATRMENMFQNCYALEEIDVSGWDTSHVVYLYATFNNCYVLEDLDVSGWDTSAVTRMDRLFRNCYALDELDVSNFDTSSVTRIGQMFQNCTSLVELDLSSFDTSSVSGTVTSSNQYNGMGNMFAGCSSLQVVTFGENWSFYGKGTSSSTCTPAYLPDAGCSSGMWVRVDATYGPYVSGISYTDDTGAPITDGYSTDNLTDQWNVAASAALMSGTWVWYYPSGSYQLQFDAGADGEPYDGEMATMTLDLELSSGTSTYAAGSFDIPENQFQRSGYTFAGWMATVVDDEGQAVSATDADGNAVTSFAVAAESSVVSQFAQSTASAMLTYSYADDDGAVVSGTLVVGDGYVITLTAQWVEADETVTSGTWSTTITLHAGQYAVFERAETSDDATTYVKDIPYNTTYTVTEGDPEDGWSLVSVSTSTSGSTSTSEGTVNTTASTETSATVTGAIASNVTTSVSYVNEYVPEATSVTLAASVKLDGKALSVADAYVYSLYEGTSTDDDAVLTANNDASGAVSFESIEYTQAGTYYYVITQTTGSADDYDYDAIVHDTHVEYVKVVVEDVDAELVATVLYSDTAWDESTEGTEDAVFYNVTYTAEDVTWAPNVVKVLTGGIDLTADAYSFTMTDASGASVMTGANGKASYSASEACASAAVAMSALDGASTLTYSLEDAGSTYTYTIVEDAGTQTGVVYDTATWTVAVTVTDNGDGTLSVSAVYSRTVDGVTSSTDESGAAYTAATFENSFENEADLPEAGRDGLKLWLLVAGLAVVALCAGLLARSARRSKREAHSN